MSSCDAETELTEINVVAGATCPSYSEGAPAPVLQTDVVAEVDAVSPPQDVLRDDPSRGRGCLQALLPHGGLVSSGFNMASATLGAGTLSLPTAINHCGVLPGIIFLAVCCSSTVYTVRLLVTVMERTGHKTYEQMAKNLVGPAFEKTTIFLIVLFCWGISVVYLVAIKDALEPLQTLSVWPEALAGIWGRRLLTTVFWACFMLPLSIRKDVNSLRFASVAGVLSSVYLSIAIVVHGLRSENAVRNLVWVRFDFSMLMAMPICIFSFCCQTNVFEIYNEMRPRSKNRITVSAIASMTLCTCLYVAAGASGAADFGDETEGDILSNYEPTESAYLAFGFAAITVTLSMAFPICIMPTRDACLHLMHYKDVYDVPASTRIVVAGLLSVVSLIMGLFTPGIEILFGLLGGICGSALAFIWPAVFVLSLGDWDRAHVGLRNVIAVWALVVGGCFAGALGTITSVLHSLF